MALPAVYIGYLINFLVSTAVAVTAIAWWLANRRRLADETIGRARAEAERVTKQAERDAESLRKEAVLEAREKAHDIASEAEQQVRQQRQEVITLEQALADKTRALADRLAATDRLEQDLRGREKLMAQQEQSAAAAVARSDQLVAERQRELQRVAGLTADEARDLLLRQI